MGGELGVSIQRITNYEIIPITLTNKVSTSMTVFSYNCLHEVSKEPETIY